MYSDLKQTCTILLLIRPYLATFPMLGRLRKLSFSLADGGDCCQQSSKTDMFCLSLKQTYPGSCIGLPRIIGGSDLAIYQCAERLDKDEWFLEVKEVRHQSRFVKKL